MNIKYNFISSLIITSMLFSCNDYSELVNQREYSPESIEEIIFEENSVGEQLLKYLDGEGDSICVLNYTNFESGSSVIIEVEKKELIDLAVVIKAFNNIKISVEGHTDSRGDERSNQELSEKRAISVKDFLVSEGINEDRLSTKGYGETRPIASNTTTDGKAKNRRVEIAVLE